MKRAHMPALIQKPQNFSLFAALMYHAARLARCGKTARHSRLKPQPLGKPTSDTSREGLGPPS